jgi:hypothetical protein
MGSNNQKAGQPRQSSKTNLSAILTTAPVSHQKQPERNTTNASKSNENAVKSTNLIDILPLIPVWLQFRVGIIR